MWRQRRPGRGAAGSAAPPSQADGTAAPQNLSVIQDLIPRSDLPYCPDEAQMQIWNRFLWEGSPGGMQNLGQRARLLFERAEQHAPLDLHGARTKDSQK